MPALGNGVRRSTAVKLLAAAIVATALLAPISGIAEGGSSSASLAKKLERLKFVTGAYHNEAVALATGFEAEPVCASSPQGGMGFHYVNQSRMEDNAVHRDKPEMLLYGTRVGSERKLLGMEFWKVDEDQDLSTDGDRPTLFGRPFDGPMPGHFPGMPIHYDLHVWLWRKNPDGLFAPFNPLVSCPG
jgi:hypothetical protein